VAEKCRVLARFATLAGNHCFLAGFVEITGLDQQFRPMAFDPLFDFAADLKGEGKGGFCLDVRNGTAHFVGTLIPLLPERVDSWDEFLRGVDREFERLYRVVVLVPASHSPIARRSQHRRRRCRDRVIGQGQARIGGQLFRLLIVGYLCVRDAEQVADFVGAALMRA